MSGLAVVTVYRLALGFSVEGFGEKAGTTEMTCDSCNPINDAGAPSQDRAASGTSQEHPAVKMRSEVVHWGV